uniref:Uncharacterized protein n=1 Tax=Anguilla anguilla TaxID=7936 RepID=A0A0E9XQ15_ANGAN
MSRSPGRSKTAMRPPAMRPPVPRRMSLQYGQTSPATTASPVD